MRIVGGSDGSRSLNTLEGMDTRPTADKVRGALFSRLGPYFSGGSFLDLFGGSGACALEALSRGMDEAYIIEANSRAIKVIESNIALLKRQKQSSLIKGDSFKVIDRLDKEFDLIFMDPPYDYPELEALIEKITDSDICGINTDLVIESDSKKELKETYNDFELIKEKSYGHAKLWYYRHKDI